MRTKTLLIAAAALAATVSVSQAQTVYSQNVVGYINLTLTNNNLVMCANQLDTGSNTLDNVLQSGVASKGTLLLQWTGTGYHTYSYYNSSDASGNFYTGGAGWYAGTANVGSTLNIGPTANGLASAGVDGGFFLENVSGSTITIPTVGQVVQGTNIYAFSNTGAQALQIYSVPAPLAGLSLDNTNINFPAVSKGTLYLQWNGKSGYNTLAYYNSSDASGNFYTGGAGWYSGTANEDQNPSYWPTAGGSFFIENLSSKTILWTNVFEVQ